MAKAPKKTPAFDGGQMAFTFDPLPLVSSDGALAGIEREISSAVARILKEDHRTRYEIAGGVSALLDDEVSKAMLDAYCSEAKETHNISLGRFMALIAETGRYDVLRALVARIGAKLVMGEEALTVELGHLVARKQEIDDRINHLRKVAPAISTTGGRRK